MKRQTFAAGASALALALLLAACGSDDPLGTQPTGSGSADVADGLSGELNGAGASSQESAMNVWRAGFQDANPDVTVNYDPVGSGGGRTAFLDGSVSFAGTDSALTADELTAAAARCSGTAAVDLPVYVSPIAVVFNLDGIETLDLTPAVVAAVFDGAITSWDDPAIAATNPGVELPALAITPVHRSDESGTTKNFTDYLAKAAPEAWPHEASGDWPTEGGESAQGTSGLVQAVQGGQGTIGYADFSKAGGLGQVAVAVGDHFVAPSAEGAATVLDVSPRDTERAEGDIVISLDRTTTEAGAYPIVLVSYLVVCQAYDSAAEADLVRGFVSHAVSAEGQQAAASSAGSAPISDALRAEIQAVLDTITG